MLGAPWRAMVNLASPHDGLCPDGQIFFIKAWHMDSYGSRKEEPRDASAGLLDDAGCVLDWPGVLPSGYLT